MLLSAALSDSCAAKWLRYNAGRARVLDETDPMWDFYRFKQGFGGEFTPRIGAWDYPVSRASYCGYTVAMPKVLDVIR